MDPDPNQIESLDPNPHQRDKLDPDPHQSDKLDPNPDPHQFTDDKPKWKMENLSTFSRIWAFIWKLGSAADQSER